MMKINKKLELGGTAKPCPDELDRNRKVDVTMPVEGSSVMMTTSLPSFWFDSLGDCLPEQDIAQS